MKRVVVFPVLLTLALGVSSAWAESPKTCEGLAATIVGTSGDDILVGTPGDDVIVGLGGSDAIRGGGGNDVICGGSGDDSVSGSGGDDRLFGGPGQDYIDGGEGGCCSAVADTGDDQLFGGPGEDALHTSDFPTLGNTLHGEQGNDSLFVWSGGWAYGGEGDDVIRQYTGNATLDGGNGDDSILDWNDGGHRFETILMQGGHGDDSLRSEDITSTAQMDGGSGSDICAGGDGSTDCEL